MKRGMTLFTAVILAGVIAAPTMAMAAGQGATATQFSLSYYQPGFPTGALWTCSGVHIVQTNPHNAFVKDSETCLATGNTAGYAAGTYTNDPGSLTGYIAGLGAGMPWYSDYWYSVTGNLVPPSSDNWTITEIDNGNGTFTIHIVAYF